MKRTITQLLLMVIGMPLGLWSQSPANLNNDIGWNGSYLSEQDIENAYNFARRGEEIQLGLATNALGNLTLPTDWSMYTSSQKALYIINDERMSRGGIDYGYGPCLGLPLDALENNLNDIAQSHGDWLVNNNSFSHTGENGWSPFDRIDNDPVLGTLNNCHDFLTRAENLTGFWTSSSSIPIPIERSIYGWIYDDAIAYWGHREAILLQDKDLYQNPWGFTNNFSTASSEGFLGVGLVEVNNGAWNPFGLPSWLDAGTLVVMNIMDPVASASCVYNMPASAPGVLPIELIDFYGREKETSIDLTWFTASEKDNDYFSIQHGKNGKEFSEIGIVEGYGNSQITQTYQFSHLDPKEGINYYRLEQFDTDGTSSYSKIIAIRRINGWSASIYPNPIVDTDLTINITSEQHQFVELVVFNTANQLIENRHLDLSSGLNQEKIETYNFSKGNYILMIVNDEKRQVIKFSKM